ncbi:hypothetical protein [Endozoicomonas sp. ONNA2]|uniref:hypothetical protein n=1 Tax=Endozoicomonas sp. ONNA2 TaxID=2828741 RepID=UPI0021472E6C|nr:hypothetical protein [Endozoicomonas sp. ONNA2]
MNNDIANGAFNTRFASESSAFCDSAGSLSGRVFEGEFAGHETRTSIDSAIPSCYPEASAGNFDGGKVLSGRMVSSDRHSGLRKIPEINCLVINCREGLGLPGHNDHKKGSIPREFGLVFQHIPVYCTVEAIAGMLKHQLLDLRIPPQPIAAGAAKSMELQTFAKNGITFVNQIGGSFKQNAQGECEFQPDDREGPVLLAAKENVVNPPSYVESQLFNLSAKNGGTIIYADDTLANPIRGVVDHDGKDWEFGLVEIKVVLPEDVWSAYGGKQRKKDETLATKLEFMKYGWSTGRFRNPAADPRIAVIVASIPDENTRNTVATVIDSWKQLAKEEAYLIGRDCQLEKGEEKRLVMNKLRGKIMQDIKQYHPDKSQGVNQEVVQYLNAAYEFMK